MQKLPKAWTTVTPLSKGIALAILIIFPFIGFFLGMDFAKSAKNSEVSSRNNFDQNKGCAKLTVDNYDNIAEYSVDLQGDKDNELVRIYARPSTTRPSVRIPPLVVKVFGNSPSNNCYSEKFSQNFGSYDIATSDILSGIWDDLRDGVVFINKYTPGTDTFDGQLEFVTYTNHQFKIIPGPKITNMQSYMYDKEQGAGFKIYVMRPVVDSTDGQGSKYQFYKEMFNGEGYTETKLGQTKNNYTPEMIQLIVKAEPKVLEE